MSEVLTAEQFIYKQLKDTNINAYAYNAPANSKKPVVIYSFLSGNDVSVVSAYRLMSEMLFLVKAVSEGNSFAEVDALADRIDSVLHNIEDVTTPGGLVLSSVRDRPFSMVENVDGKRFNHRGGIYRIRIN